MRLWSMFRERADERVTAAAWRWWRVRGAWAVCVCVAAGSSGCVYRSEPARVRSSAVAYAASIPPASLALEPVELADAYAGFGSEEFVEFARADDALGSLPGPLLATSEWPEVPRADPSFRRFVNLPSTAQTLIFFRSSPGTFSGVQDRRSAARRPFGPFFSPR